MQLPDDIRSIPFRSVFKNVMLNIALSNVQSVTNRYPISRVARLFAYENTGEYFWIEKLDDRIKSVNQTTTERKRCCSHMSCRSRNIDFEIMNFNAFIHCKIRSELRLTKHDYNDSNKSKNRVNFLFTFERNEMLLKWVFHEQVQSMSGQEGERKGDEGRHEKINGAKWLNTYALPLHSLASR